MWDSEKVTQYALSKILEKEKTIEKLGQSVLYYFLSIMSQRKYIDYA